jgi:hypothetical protein
MKPVSRYLALSVGIAAVFLGIYNVFAPTTLGQLEMHVAGSHGAPVVTSLRPGGTAERAGIRTGDAIQLAGMSYNTRLCVLRSLCHLGNTYSLAVIHDGVPKNVQVRAVQSFYDNPTGRYIDLALAFLYVIFGCVVMVKAPRTRLSALLVWMMMLYALDNAVPDFGQVAPNEISAALVQDWLTDITIYALSVLIILSIATLDVGSSVLRSALARWAPLLAVFSIFSNFIDLAGLPGFPAFSLTTIQVFSAITVGYNIIAGVFTAILIQSAPLQSRVRVRWFASSIIVFWFFGFALFWLNAAFIANDALSYFSYYLLSFGLVGPVYATLRHRLIDLDVVLSRSAVYAAVSLVLVAAFAIAEWVASKLADVLAGQGRWRGLTAQLLSFAAAIGVGLWIRHVHGRTERSINSLIFQERERKLRLLEHFAREADYVDDRDVLLKVTFEALAGSVESPDIALYIADGDNFACVRTSSALAPERMDQSNRPILFLLSNGTSFLNETEPLLGWFIVPLMARSHVIGFIACGPKRDHTRYLSEEVSALQNVAHHVGTSYAMLPARTVV